MVHVGMMTRCPCGDAAAHIVARRKTADGIGVCLWSDGTVMGRFAALPDVPVVRPRTADAVATARAAGWLLVALVELYDLEQVPDLYEAAQWAATRSLDVDAVRQRFDREASPIRFVWTVQATDSRGATTLRTCTLNRVQFPGLAVWHERGVYELMSRAGASPLCRSTDRDVYETTGLSFRSQRALSAHLVGLLRERANVQVGL